MTSTSNLYRAVDHAAFCHVLDGSSELGFRGGHLGASGNLGASAILLAVVDGLEAQDGGRYPHDGEFQDALLVLEFVDTLQLVVVDADLRAVDLHLDIKVVVADPLGGAFNGESASSPIDAGFDSVGGSLGSDASEETQGVVAGQVQSQVDFALGSVEVETAAQSGLLVRDADDNVDFVDLAVFQGTDIERQFAALHALERSGGGQLETQLAGTAFHLDFDACLRRLALVGRAPHNGERAFAAGVGRIETAAEIQALATGSLVGSLEHEVHVNSRRRQPELGVESDDLGGLVLGSQPLADL